MDEREQIRHLFALFLFIFGVVVIIVGYQKIKDERELHKPFEKERTDYLRYHGPVPLSLLSRVMMKFHRDYAIKHFYFLKKEGKDGKVFWDMEIVWTFESFFVTYFDKDGIERVCPKSPYVEMSFLDVLRVRLFYLRCTHITKEEFEGGHGEEAAVPQV